MATALHGAFRAAHKSRRMLGNRVPATLAVIITIAAALAF